MPHTSGHSRHDGSSRRYAVIGWICSALVMLILAVSAYTKMSTPSPEVATAIARFGYPAERLSAIAAVEVACMLLYGLPPTALLGGVLLTGYLGGAVATHVRLADDAAALFPVAVGALAWAGLYLRDSRFRRLVWTSERSGA